MLNDRRADHFILNVVGTTEVYTKAVSAFRCSVQPASGESTVMINGVYGQVYTMYTTYSGLQIGDYITLSGTTTTSGYRMKVKAVKNYGFGPLPHFEVTLALPEA